MLKGRAIAGALGAIVAVGAHVHAACRPQAILEGDAALVAPIAAALRLRGIGDPHELPLCPTVVVRLERREGRIVASVVDGPRRSERSLSDEETAATFIESWALKDVSEPLWTAGDRPAAAVAPAAPPATAAGPLPRAALAVASSAAEMPPRLSVGASLEGTVGFDGIPWLGAEVDAAARVGRFTIGLLARVADSASETTASGLTFDRLLVGLAFRLALPLRFGRLRLIPAAAVGMAWVRSRFRDAAFQSNESGAALTGEVSLGLGARVWRELEVEITAALDGNLVAADDGELNGAEMDADETAERQLPALASGMVRLALGLRWGKP